VHCISKDALHFGVNLSRVVFALPDLQRIWEMQRISGVRKKCFNVKSRGLIPLLIAWFYPTLEKIFPNYSLKMSAFFT